jgi:NADPH:quinone reductase-like Zn-dependent oxidoreductase
MPVFPDTETHVPPQITSRVLILVLCHCYVDDWGQGICGWGGGLAEYIAIDVQFVHILPEGISCELFATTL